MQKQYSTVRKTETKNCVKSHVMIYGDRISNNVRFSHMFCMRWKIINKNADFMSVFLWLNIMASFGCHLFFTYQRQVETSTLFSAYSRCVGNSRAADPSRIWARKTHIHKKYYSFFCLQITMIIRYFDDYSYDSWMCRR